MSCYVVNTGFMAEIENPISRNEWSKYNDKFYEDDIGINLNYEGTIVYSTDTEENLGDYGLKIANTNINSIKKFVENAKKYGLIIKEDTIRTYSCIWYNGADSDMSLLTLEEYNNEKN